MTKFIRMVNGIPTTVDESLGGGISYQESVPVTNDIGNAGTGYDSTHKIFTLPNGKEYNGNVDELMVSRNGVDWNEGVEFTYEESATATTITCTNAQPKNSRVEFKL